MAFPETDESGKFLRPKQAARGQSFFGATNESRLGIDKQNAARMGISLDAYRRGWHKDLGGEDWLDRLPKEARLEDLQRGLADLYAQKDVERDRENSPLTQQEKDVKEYKDAIVELEKRRLQKEYNEQQRALGLGGRNAMMSKPPGGGGFTVEDVADSALTVAEYAPTTAIPAGMIRGVVDRDPLTTGFFAAAAGGALAGKTKKGKRFFKAAKDLAGRATPYLPFLGMRGQQLREISDLATKGTRPEPKPKPKPKPTQYKGQGVPTGNLRKYIYRGLGG